MKIFCSIRKRAMEFRDCVIAGGKKISIFAFSSGQGISQYTVAEIRRMGDDGFGFAYEGTRSNYRQAARPRWPEIFTEFRSTASRSWTSMIVGF